MLSQVIGLMFKFLKQKRATRYMPNSTHGNQTRQKFMRMAFNKSETPLQPRPRLTSSMMTSHFDVGASLIAAQKQAGISNLKLAKDFGVCKQTATRWRSKADQKVSVVFALSDYFGMSCESFLDLGRWHEPHNANSWPPNKQADHRYGCLKRLRLFSVGGADQWASHGRSQYPYRNKEQGWQAVCDVSLAEKVEAKKSPSREGPITVQGRDVCDIFKASTKKMNGLYTTKPFRILPHLLFCQRLLGVRPRNLRTSETELTLSIMRLPVPRAGKGNRCQDSIQ